MVEGKRRPRGWARGGGLEIAALVSRGSSPRAAVIQRVRGSLLWEQQQGGRGRAPSARRRHRRLEAAPLLTTRTVPCPSSIGGPPAVGGISTVRSVRWSGSKCCRQRANHGGTISGGGCRPYARGAVFKAPFRTHVCAWRCTAASTRRRDGRCERWHGGGSWCLPPAPRRAPGTRSVQRAAASKHRPQNSL